jgi:hypothetical protein
VINCAGRSSRGRQLCIRHCVTWHAVDGALFLRLRYHHRYHMFQSIGG